MNMKHNFHDPEMCFFWSLSKALKGAGREGPTIKTKCDPLGGSSPKTNGWIPKIAIFEMRYISKTIMFGIYVRFRGGYVSSKRSFPFFVGFREIQCEPREKTLLLFIILVV